MVRSCCYPECTNREGSPVSFYSFPLDDEKRDIWINVCQLKVYRKSFKVCSEHFLSTDFRDITDTTRGLLYNAVPISQEGTTRPDEIEYLEECIPSEPES
ncbi:hypothetical protein pipiens_006613 [Culex pipiens pipiens]|uniref:THAP-type domain-containing protein n=1 Tax=Culex pipiens pipiens TaxID=38569 RepID=A0ABD1DP96_CULPP